MRKLFPGLYVALVRSSLMLSAPREAYNSILSPVHMKFGAQTNVTAGKTSATGARSWPCIGVPLLRVRRYAQVLSGFLRFPFFAGPAARSIARGTQVRRVALRPSLVYRFP